jgi:hypothetical protein
MDYLETRYRPDEQLEVILDDATQEWTVYGPRGVVVCRAKSLRTSMEQAYDTTSYGQKIVAVACGPDDAIIVFSDQLWRLFGRMSEGASHEAERAAA